VPLERTVDGSVAVHVGPSAELVDLAGGVIPLALAPYVEAIVAGIATWAATYVSSPTTPALYSDLAALAAAITAATGVLPPATTKVTAQ
jgi:hypothetical protein